MTSQSLDYTKKAFQLTALSLALALSGCGGGSTVDSVAPAPGGNGNTGNNGGNGNDNGGEIVEVLNISALSLVDTNGDMTRVVSGLGATASVKVTDAKGSGVSGALVTFNGEGVKFGTTNGAVLTNTDGVASISVMPQDQKDTGSYQISATATYEEKTITSAAYFISIRSAKTNIDQLIVNRPMLSSGDSTNVTLVTVDANSNMIQNNIVVNFSSTCGSFSQSTVTSTNQGNVTTTYKSIDDNGNLCEGTQTISATPANDLDSTKSTTVQIANVQANSLVYTTAGAIQLGAANSGSSSSNVVEFTVYSNGIPASNQEVLISKVYAPNDFSFVKLGNKGTVTVKSDTQGRVVVPVYPGALPGPVEMRAALKSDDNIFALSKNVSVATGRASQNGMSISLSKNVLLFGTDGDTATITARLVDRLGNAVPDGTVISFISEGGAITPNCSTNKGICTVEFSTQNPRPVDDRVSIIAYLEGDKSYIDTDGDNSFTFGIDKLINNIGNFFRDDNENNKYDANLGEFVYRRDIADNVTPSQCGTSSFVHPNISGTCDNGLAAVLRYQFVFGLASDKPVFDGLPSVLAANPENDLKTPIIRSFKMYGNGAGTVSMPSGTTISVTAEDKTSFTPTVELVNGNIQVSSAEPNSTAIVKAGSASFSVAIGANGTGTRAVDLPSNATLSIAYTNVNCEAKLTEGFETIPNVVNLSGGSVSDDQISYKFSYSGCRPNDQIKVTVNSPSTTRSTKIIRIN
jgi:hypothetical protein